MLGAGDGGLSQVGGWVGALVWLATLACFFISISTRHCHLCNLSSDTLAMTLLNRIQHDLVFVGALRLPG